MSCSSSSQLGGCWPRTCPRPAPRKLVHTAMKRKRFTEEQIIGILKEAEAGAKSTDLCRRHAISEQTVYRWKAKDAGLEANEARRLRTLEDENGRLKRRVADLTLDNQAFTELVG